MTYVGRKGDLRWGLITTTLGLTNARANEMPSMSVSALVDTGALHLCIPEHVCIQLDLIELEKREVSTADGKRHRVPYVGPIIIKWGSRQCITGALVLGNEVLLGAIPMEDLDLIIIPSTLSVSVNPNSPNIPMSVAKGLIE